MSMDLCGSPYDKLLRSVNNLNAMIFQSKRCSSWLYYEIINADLLVSQKDLRAIIVWVFAGQGFGSGT